MIGITDSLLIIAVAAVCTFLTRALPFMIFKNAEALPRKIVYLGNVLPMAIMLCLIVYCVRNTSFFQYPYGLPELLGIGSVVLLHVWKRNNMISIIGEPCFIWCWYSWCLYSFEGCFEPLKT